VTRWPLALASLAGAVLHMCTAVHCVLSQPIGCEVGAREVQCSHCVLCSVSVADGCQCGVWCGGVWRGMLQQLALANKAAPYQSWQLVDANGSGSVPNN
jgi:hypothetical protein